MKKKKVLRKKIKILSFQPKYYAHEIRGIKIIKSQKYKKIIVAVWLTFE